MNEKVLRVLEYNKILDLVADMAVSRDSKKKIAEMMPTMVFDEVLFMQNATDEAASMIAMYGALPSAPMTNITLPIKRAEMGGNLSLKEILATGVVLRVTRQIIKYMAETDKFDILNGMNKNLVADRNLEISISDSIISEDMVADGASPELAALRRKINQLNGKVKDVLNNMIHSSAYSKYLQDPIVTMRGDRYVIPVKSEHRGNVQGILHDSSATGATVFIEPIAVVQINNQLRDVMIAEEREIERIIADFSSQIALISGILKTNYDTIIDMEILFAKAAFSNKFKCIKPVLNKEGYTVLKKARHPLIDTKTVVPISVYLGKDFDTLVITGPNTGGKTVTLKTLGLLSLMCQSGLHVPADIGTQMPVYENIFADIGDEQSIEQSLSTFSSHMVNIVDILNNAQQNSLALFDELGAGTDPDEGAALAIEILEFIRGCGAKAVATTHYSELKMYALSTDRVENASCEFDVATLSPTYRLLIGVPGKSNAFAISKRLGLFDTIIEKAANRMTAESVRFEDIVTELQRKREAAVLAHDESLRIKVESEALREELKRQQSDIKARREKLMDDARREAREIISRANEETNELMKQVRKLSQESVSKDQLRQMEDLKSQIRQKGSVAANVIKRQKSNTVINDITLGMTVEVLSLEDKGTVVSMPNNNGDFQVQVGIMKIKTNVSDVRPVEDKTHLKAGQQLISNRKNVSSKSLNIKTEIDIRGFTAFEGIMEIEKFIDDAMLASLPKISIIHGKGTGALRSAVHQQLKQNKFVKSFRLGSFGEGDTGVTIVELK